MSALASCVSFLSIFFSSRRRHTRLQGDWSSDVCSSDLPLLLIHMWILEKLVAADFPHRQPHAVIDPHGDIRQLLPGPAAKRCDMIGSVASRRPRREIVVRDTAAAALAYHLTHRVPRALIRLHDHQPVETAMNGALRFTRPVVP